MVTNCDLAKLKFSESLPFAFTEYGAIAIANVLASPQAVEMGIYVVRTFVRLLDMAGLHKDLAERLEQFEEKTEALDALKELMTLPEPPKRPIGFVLLDDKSKR